MEGVGAKLVKQRLLEPKSVDRARPAREVLDWLAFDDWQSEIWSLLKPYVSDEVRALFLKAPPEYVVGDDVSWLENLIARAGNNHIDIKSYLVDQLCERYRSIRAFHGARPLDIKSYYRVGLKPLCIREAAEQLDAIFLTEAFPELDAQTLRSVMHHVGADTREGRVYFEANERHLVERCGHYMLYGSEYILAVAANLPGPKNYRPHLKKIGEPTVFVCDVPLSLLHPGTLAEFAGSAIEHVFSALLEKGYKPSWTRGAGFSIRERLPSSCVIGHYHPSIKSDPFARFEY